MPHALSTVLGIDPDSLDARRGLRQVDYDIALFDELIARRRELFPDEDSFAAKVGWTPGAVPPSRQVERRVRQREW